MRTEDRDVDIEPDDTLPSVEITMRFLALYDRFGSEEAALAAMAGGGELACRGCPSATTGRPGTRQR